MLPVRWMHRHHYSPKSLRTGMVRQFSTPRKPYSPDASTQRVKTPVFEEIARRLGDSQTVHNVLRIVEGPITELMTLYSRYPTIFNVTVGVVSASAAWVGYFSRVRHQRALERKLEARMERMENRMLGAVDDDENAGSGADQVRITEPVTRRKGSKTEERVPGWLYLVGATSLMAGAGYAALRESTRLRALRRSLVPAGGTKGSLAETVTPSVSSSSKQVSASAAQPSSSGSTAGVKGSASSTSPTAATAENTSTKATSPTSSSSSAAVKDAVSKPTLSAESPTKASSLQTVSATTGLPWLVPRHQYPKSVPNFRRWAAGPGVLARAGEEGSLRQHWRLFAVQVLPPNVCPTVSYRGQTMKVVILAGDLVLVSGYLVLGGLVYLQHVLRFSPGYGHIWWAATVGRLLGKGNGHVDEEVHEVETDPHEAAAQALQKEVTAAVGKQQTHTGHSVSTSPAQQQTITQEPQKDAGVWTHSEQHGDDTTIAVASEKKRNRLAELLKGGRRKREEHEGGLHLSLEELEALPLGCLARSELAKLDFAEECAAEAVGSHSSGDDCEKPTTVETEAIEGHHSTNPLFDTARSMLQAYVACVEDPTGESCPMLVLAVPQPSTIAAYVQRRTTAFSTWIVATVRQLTAAAAMLWHRVLSAVEEVRSADGPLVTLSGFGVDGRSQEDRGRSEDS
eukprot:Clim_evm9s8 gene=Clim_evmTU9s8